jgi:hypothetical protein
VPPLEARQLGAAPADPGVERAAQPIEDPVVLEKALRQSITYTVERDDSGGASEIVIRS